MLVTVQYQDVDIDVNASIEGKYYRATSETPEELPEVVVHDTSYDLSDLEAEPEELEELRQGIGNYLSSSKFLDDVYDAIEDSVQAEYDAADYHDYDDEY